MPASLNLDDLIRRVLSVAVEDGDRDYLKECVAGSEFVNLCHAVKKVLLQQPSMIEVEPPITVVGDIHGQFRDLVRIFNRCGYPPQTNYMFLGDYVDRGKQSLETACLLFAYKLKYPENFFLLRGNHECAPVNKVYGFYEECARRYNVRLWQIIQDVFNCLPFTGLISGRIICMHGGLSPHLRNWQQLRNIRRPLDPVEPLHTDLLWSDPDNFISGWSKSPRGISGVFGADVVQDFCARMEVDLIVRAHQVVQDGYELFANRRLVTIFSAPRYCGTFDNAGGMMTVSEDLTCAFHILKPALKPLRITSS